jgi:proteic killer suppression protein
MIQGFKHKGLRRLFEHDDPSGLAAAHVEKIRLILLALHSADTIEAMNLPTFRLHP